MNNNKIEYFGVNVDIRFWSMVECADINKLNSLIKEGFAFNLDHTYIIDEKIWELKNSFDRKDLSWKEVDNLKEIRKIVSEHINKNKIPDVKSMIGNNNEKGKELTM